jgi:pyruvate dehydrogenase (quinone)
MSQTVSDFLIRRLAAWGVRRIYGYPGDGINGVIGAIGRADGVVEFIQPRHEEAASFMACAHAKFTGEVGVCLGTSGPGSIHLATGLYDARADHQPVVAICGQKPRTSLGGDFQQEVDLLSLFQDVAREYIEMVTVPAQLRHVVDRAFRIALSRRAPTCIILPSDVQKLDAKQPSHQHGNVQSGLGYRPPIVVPARHDIDRAAEVLNAGERVAMLIGAGAAGAGDEVLQVADRLGAGIAKALLGKPVLPDAIPYVTGGIGLLGTRPSYEMMRDCDTLLMIGSGFPYIEFLPQEGSARGVQIDVEARMLSLRYPMEVNLVGDAAATLRALLPRLQPRKDDRWRRTIERNVGEWWETLRKRAMLDGDPVNPQRVFWELSPRLPANVMLTCDTGTSVHWYSRDLKLQHGMQAAHSGGLASMGAAVPYAVAAKFAYPDRPVIAFVGDGAMQMNGLNELITVAKYWRTWADPRFIVLVLNNRDLNMVTWEQRVLEGNPKFPGSQDLPDFSYTGYAHLLGFDGHLIDKRDRIVPSLEAALASRRPAVVEVLADPNIPPLAPHTTAKQAKDYLLALMSGDPDAMEVIRASAKQLFA